MVLSTEAFSSVVAVGGEVDPEPVLAGDDWRRQSGTSQPEETSKHKRILMARGSDLHVQVGRDMKDPPLVSSPSLLNPAY